MRVVFVTESELEFQEAWDRLWNGGIPVMEPSTHSNLPGYKVGAHTRTLCVWLDQQYEDAVALLKNPSHVVSAPVDPEEFQRIQDQVQVEHTVALDRTNERVLNWLIGVGGVAALGFAAYLVLR